MCVVPDCVDDGHELRLNSALRERQIHGGEHLLRGRLDRSVGPQDPAYQSRIDGCWGPFSAYVSNGDAEPRHRIWDEVVKSSANRSCRDEFGCDVEMRELRTGLRQQS